MDIRLLVLSAGAAGCVMLAVLGLSRALLAHEHLVRTRLAALDAPATREAQSPRFQDVLRARRTRVAGPLDRFMRRLVGAAARRQLERAGLPLTVGEFVAIRFSVALAAGVITAAIGTARGLPVAPSLLVAAGGVLGLVTPAIYLGWRTKRRMAQIERQLVELCDVMSTMLMSGFGYLQALQVSAEQVGRPLGDEVQRFLGAVSLGSDFEVALDELRVRLDSPDFEVIATALEVQRRTGGNLAEILRGVGLTIRERQAFHREIRALTSRERFSAVIVAIFPLLLVGLLSVLMPDVFGRLFIDPVGRLLFGAALVMDFVGYSVARRLATLEM